MYATGLAPFYASYHLNLWPAYCIGAAASGAVGFATLDTAKKPSFCIADILHAGDPDSPPCSSALTVGVMYPAQYQSAAGSPLRPTPVTPESGFHHRLSPLPHYQPHRLRSLWQSENAREQPASALQQRPQVRHPSDLIC
ncbi:hypothetical protein XELAEV_18015224mg [Xenopus laevis]|uniref:Uncharacterized protein n=2 Tax=Xenopus laevis TaxID=8355 RepID=A0A974DIQ9_XENLA|nr:hypothetical protein XELAEV_18015224mg [Xenopus laevis]